MRLARAIARRETSMRRDLEAVLSQSDRVRAGAAAQIERAPDRHPAALDHRHDLRRRDAGVPRRFLEEIHQIPEE